MNIWDKIDISNIYHISKVYLFMTTKKDMSDKTFDESDSLLKTGFPSVPELHNPDL